MAPIERDDWTGGPPVDVPAPSPGKEQAIARPDWDGTQPETPPAEASKSETHPDWPLPDKPAEEPAKYLVVDTPAIEEATPLDPDMLADLAASGEHDLGVAGEAVTAIQNAIPAADHTDFEAGFDVLPTETQQAIIGELALSDREADADEYETYASDDEVEQFATTQEGSALVAEWGSSADHRLGIIQARLLRMENAADMSAAWEWFDALPPAQAKAVLRELAR